MHLGRGLGVEDWVLSGVNVHEQRTWCLGVNVHGQRTLCRGLGTWWVNAHGIGRLGIIT